MTKNYDVGFKKPPKHSQFKPGQSGNPKGAPKKPKLSPGELLMSELNANMSVQFQGKTVKMSRLNTLIKSVFGEALKTKDIKKMQALVKFIQSLHDPRSEAMSEHPQTVIQFIDDIK